MARPASCRTAGALLQELEVPGAIDRQVVKSLQLFSDRQPCLAALLEDASAPVLTVLNTSRGAEALAQERCTQLTFEMQPGPSDVSNTHSQDDATPTSSSQSSESHSTSASSTPTTQK